MEGHLRFGDPVPPYDAFGDQTVAEARRQAIWRNEGEVEISRFLSFLAVDSRVSASTQNQALNALLFLYRNVLHQDFPWLKDVVRAKSPRRLPVVLTRQEVPHEIVL